jgi:hypothetical protein
MAIFARHENKTKFTTPSLSFLIFLPREPCPIHPLPPPCVAPRRSNVVFLLLVSLDLHACYRCWYPISPSSRDESPFLGTIYLSSSLFVVSPRSWLALSTFSTITSECPVLAYFIAHGRSQIIISTDCGMNITYPTANVFRTFLTIGLRDVMWE